MRQISRPLRLHKSSSCACGQSENRWLLREFEGPNGLNFIQMFQIYLRTFISNARLVIYDNEQMRLYRICTVIEKRIIVTY